jgi:hypothetical protein
MPKRGEVDQLIVPLRPRLAVLRPARPINLARLLFMPLDPLIVPAAGWRRGTITLPRSALIPLADVARERLGPVAAATEAALAGLTTDNTQDLAQIGAGLWAAAAKVLAAAEPPDSWSQTTGLQTADFHPLSTIAAAGLAQADQIERIVRLPETDEAGQRREIGAALEPAAESGPLALATVIMLLAARLPSAAQSFFSADSIASRSGEPAMRHAVDQAIDSTIDSVESSASNLGSLSNASVALRRSIRLLDELESVCSQRPSRKARIAELRREVDTASRKQFSQALAHELLEPARALVGATDEAVIRLERSARDLRRFEMIARRLGGGDHFDRNLKQAAAALAPQPDEPRATLIDRIRLIEILQGPEAAIAAIQL